MAKARRTTGMTVKEFAAHIGVSAKTVNNAEGDVHAVRKIVMNAWSLATGVPVQWLQEGEMHEEDRPGGADPLRSVRHHGLEPRTRWLTTGLRFESLVDQAA